VGRVRTPVLAFFHRDLQIAASYRIPFLLDLFGALFVLIEFYFLAKLVPETASTGNYLDFVVTGLVVTTFLVSAASVITAGIRQEQLQGTLELMLSTGIRMPALALGISAYPLTAGAIRGTIYVAVAAVLGARVAGANWGLAAVALGLGSISFVAIGLISVGLVLIFRQAAGAVGWLLGVVTLLAGVVFPLDLLPGWLRFLSGLSAATWTLRVVRTAVLEGGAWAESLSSLVILFALGVIYAGLGIAALAWALRFARRSGALSQY
jgi:ABC-2 type transport system permease protein